jgi:DinB superfamily
VLLFVYLVLPDDGRVLELVELRRTVRGWTTPGRGRSDNRSMTGSSQPTLDELRRARGEGWQWPRTATDACPQCGFHSGALPRGALAPKLLESAAAWHEFLLAAGDAYLRTNPEPGVFSPLQYGAHVRDILRVYGDRVLLAVAEDNPTFPQFNPEEDVWVAYNQLGAAELAADLDAQARRLAGILDGLTPEGWSRTLTRDGGKDGVFTFTVAGQACYAVHEAHHHLLDANGTLPDGAARL